MGEFQAAVVFDAPQPWSDEALDLVLDQTVRHGGVLTIQSDSSLRLVFTVQSAVAPGFGGGIVQVLPAVMSVAAHAMKGGAEVRVRAVEIERLGEG